MSADFSAKRLCAISCNFRTAQTGFRERIALSRDAVADAYQSMKFRRPDEFLILSTCNRVEVYTVESATSEEAVSTVAVQILSDVSGVPAKEILSAAEIFENRNAAQHLFEVAAGMDSQMVGEVEILGQLKQAYEVASIARTTGPLLNRVFQKSFQSAKWIRTNTAISQGQVSIGNVSVDLAMRIFGDLRNCSVFVIGVGDAGRRVAQAFSDRGAGQITVASRTFEKANSLAMELGAASAELRDIPKQVSRSDIVVGCASVESALLGASDISALMHERAGRPLFLVDLGMPRNFDPEAKKIDDVWLYDMNDLSAITNENLAARQREIARSRIEIIRRVALLGLAS